jgi:hypothetical protein
LEISIYALSIMCKAIRACAEIALGHME